MNLSFSLKHSFPKLSEKDLVHLETVLQEKFGYPILPDDYKHFLLAHNGGYVSPGDIDNMEANYELEEVGSVYFETPLFWARDNNRPVKPKVVMFFGFYNEETMKVTSFNKWQKELYEIVASNQHSKYDYEVLPDKMMSIAKAGHIKASDMLCISLEEEDYGSVYYYYGMWYYPAKFHGSYYEDKKREILKKYEIKDLKQIDNQTELGKKIEKELDRVPFVIVADSFTNFINTLKIHNPTEN